MEVEPKYKRLLLKLSGEALMGEGSFGIDPSALKFFAEEVHEVHKLGVEIGIVIGGGKHFPRFAIRCERNRQGLRRLYGNAGNDNQLPCFSIGARRFGNRNSLANCNNNDLRRRTIHPKKSDSPS